MYRLCAWGRQQVWALFGLSAGEKGQTFRPAQQPDYDSPAFNQRRLGRSASDIEIHARELLKIKEKPANRLMAKHCGRDLADLERDTDRDNFMSAEEAKEYGLIDQILENRASLQF